MTHKLTRTILNKIEVKIRGDLKKWYLVHMYYKWEERGRGSRARPQLLVKKTTSFLFFRRFDSEAFKTRIKKKHDKAFFKDRLCQGDLIIIRGLMKKIYILELMNYFYEGILSKIKLPQTKVVVLPHLPILWHVPPKTTPLFDVTSY